MAKDDVQTNIRLPADLKDLLQDAASLSGRTFTAELVHRLQSTFESPLRLLLENRLRESAVVAREIRAQVEKLDAMVRAGASEEEQRPVRDLLEALRRHDMLIGDGLYALTGSHYPDPGKSSSKASKTAKK